jgi:hypothetical protein
MTEKITPILHTFEYCDRVEEKNGKQNFLGLFLYINALSLPAKHPSFTVVLGFSNGKGSYKGKIIIKSPTNRELTKAPFKFELPDTRVVIYPFIEIQNLQLMELGAYKIIAYLGSKKNWIIAMGEIEELEEKNRKLQVEINLARRD